MLSSLVLRASSNATHFDCTLDTCSIDHAFVHYIPSLPGNAFYLGVFSLFMLVQLYLGIRYRTIGFAIAMFMGLFLEIFGYANRILMHSNPFDRLAFIEYLVGLTIGPVFMAAGIYLCFSRIVVAYDPEESFGLLRHRSYMLIFCTCDILSLVLQSVGGAQASLADTQEDAAKGGWVMVAGLAMQVASLAIFAALSLDFGLRVRKHREQLSPKHKDLYESKRFKYFMISLSLATLFILIRSIFRVAELSGGFGGDLANDQVSFMVLEGAMVMLACICLSVFHPGFGFQGMWKAANFHFKTRSRKADNSEAEKSSETVEAEAETEVKVVDV